MSGARALHVVQIPRRFARESWGGTETVILETSKRLIASGHRSEIYCTNATAGCDREEIDGVEVRRYPYFHPYFGLSREARDRLDRKGGSPFSFSLLRALKHVKDIDLFHLHVTNRIGGIGRHVARGRGIPYLVSLHGGMFDVPAEEAASWTEPAKGAFEWGKVLGAWVGSRRVLSDAAAILCVGLPEQRAAQARLPEKRVVYLPNGVDLERFRGGDGARFRRERGIPESARILLTVGRIDGQKNQLLGVELLARLRDEEKDLRLVLIGPVTSEDYHRRLLESIAEAGLGDRVLLIQGLPPDDPALVDAYHAADCFLLSSVHEPFGIVVLEAWAAGLPVVASRVGGVPHFVEDGRDGVLFDPEEGAEAAAAALRRLRELGPAGLAEAGRRKVVESYTWDAISSRLCELYREVLDEHPRRGTRGR